MRPRFHSAVVDLVAPIALLAGLMVACGTDTNGPRIDSGPGNHPLVVGDTASFVVGAGDSLTYILHAPRSGRGAVSLESPAVNVGVEVIDSATGASLTALTSQQPPLLLLQNFSPPFAVTGGQTILFRIRRGSVGDAAMGRLFVAVTSDAPESRADTISPGIVYETEALAVPSDFDQFHFQALANHYYALYFQGIDHPEPSPFQVVAIGGVPLAAPLIGATLWADHQGTELASNSTPAFGAAEAITVTLTVSYRRGFGPGVPAIPGRYRFEIREVNWGVESGDSTLVPGDTLVDALDYSGDMDQYVIQAGIGDTVRLYGQALTGIGSQVYSITTPAGDNASAGSATPGEGSGESVTNPVVISTAGSYHAQVNGIPPEAHGTYRLAVSVHSPSPAPPK